MNEAQLLSPAQNEPQLVFDERPAQAAIEVLNPIHGGLAGDAALGLQVVRNVVADELRGRVSQVKLSVKRVTAVSRHQIRVNAAALNFGRDVAGLIGRLLQQFVIDVDLNEPVVLHGVHAHAVQQIGVAQSGLAVRRHIGLLDLLVAAYVRGVEVNAGHIRANGLHVACRGQRIHIGPRQDLGMCHVFHVDGGHLRLHLDGLAHGAHLHNGVNRHRYVGWHFHLLLHLAETLHGESHGISPGADIHDGVPSFTIRGNRA